MKIIAETALFRLRDKGLVNRLIAVARTFGTTERLEDVESELRAEWPNYFLYRGGHHVALHKTPHTPRLILITE
jgi:hypothetical protein